MRILILIVYYLVQSVLSLTVFWQIVLIYINYSQWRNTQGSALAGYRTLFPRPFPTAPILLNTSIALILLGCITGLYYYRSKLKNKHIAKREKRKLKFYPDDDEQLNPMEDPLPPNITVERFPLDNVHIKLVDEIAESLINSARFIDAEDKLRSGGKSRYVIGYMAGIIDELCQRININDGNQRGAMLQHLYENIFYEKNRSSALSNFMRLQGDALVRSGMISGGRNSVSHFNREPGMFGQRPRFSGLLFYLEERRASEERD